MKKFIFGIIALLFAFGFATKIALAFPDTIKNTTAYPRLYMNEDLEVFNHAVDPYFLRLYMKFVGENEGDTTTPVICLSGFTINRPTIGTVCTIDRNWSDINKYGIGYIHKVISGSHSENYLKYWWDEYMTLYYLDNVESRFKDTEVMERALASTILDTGKTFQQIVDEARAHASRAGTEYLLANGQGTVDLSFTLGSDGYYYSNEVTITTNNPNGYYISGEDLINPKFTYTKNGNKYVFKIKESDVGYTPESFNALITSSFAYYEASKYDCGDDVQSLTLMAYENKIIAKSISIRGSVVKHLGQLTIKKVDESGKYLPGAKIKVTGPDNYSEVFTTTNSALVIKNLKHGTYTVEEVEAPSGYVKSINKTAKISDATLNVSVTLTDKITKVKISKKGVTGDDELPGATLEIQDKDGNIIKYCTDSEGNAGSYCKWVSTTEPYEIEGIPVGTYYLVETIAPDTYAVNKEKVSFTVKDDGTVTEVEMRDALNKVVISKVSIADSKEVPGASLEIQDKDGNIVNYCTDSEGNKNKECKWISTSEPYEIEGMPNGTYYLVETIAPEGYELNTEKVEFVIDGNKATTDVKMQNEVKVPVPDTLSPKSILLIAVAMLDIALGIGIIAYVRKNKIKG